MTPLFGYVSAFLSLVMIVPYIRDISKQKTKPQRASWFIWLVLGSIAFSSQMAKGATESLWLTGGQTVSMAVIFLLSIKYGVGGFAKRDMKALFGAAVGLVLWFITQEALIALCSVILIDAMGNSLTILKSYEDPETETLSTWFISGTAGVFGMLAVGSFNPTLLLYPLYLTLASYAVVVSILLGRKKEGLKQI